MSNLPESTDVSLPVFGMTCQKCVARVTEIISACPGTSDVSVSLEDSLARFKLDGVRENNIGQIADALSAAGFTTEKERDSDGASLSSTPDSLDRSALEPLRFAVSGMSCASCAATIEKRLQKSDAIHNVSVNLAGRFASLEFDPEKITANDIYHEVERAGFKAVTDQGLAAGSHQDNELRLVLMAAVGTIPMMLLMWFPLLGDGTLVALAVLATIVQLTAGIGFYRGAWTSLKNRSANMDVLVALGITAAYGYSMLAFFGWLGPDATMFFETSAMLILFIRFGKWLESRARGRANSALSKLLELQADTAVLLQGGGAEKIVPANQVQPGDRLLVRPGDKIPVDGTVIEGMSAVDEAMISGESVPLTKEEGDEVIGGTINQTGRLVVKATRVGDQSVLAGIVRLVEAAQGDKPPIQRIADRISNVFVPGVIICSLMTFVLWYLVAQSTFLFAFQMSIAVLVIACPCALGLATPTAVMVGSSVGLEHGILFKKASALEMISNVGIVLLDKTGTLTTGRFEVESLTVVEGVNEVDLLRYAASLESGSRHPLARGVVEEAEKQNISLYDVEHFEEVGGHGLKGRVNGRDVCCGNRRLMTDIGQIQGDVADLIKEIDGDEKTLIFVAVDDKLQGLIALGDRIKPEAAKAVGQLKELGLRAIMVTGDRRVVADAVGDRIGLDLVEADVLPGRKLDIVKKYQEGGSLVAMVGDGINDAPALAQADLGIAIGSGSDIARETGDVVLVGDDLLSLARSIRLGKSTLRKIKQNLFWAFFYNLLGVPLAAGLFFPLWGLYLKPEYAGLAMALSSVSVVTNSILLKSEASLFTGE